MNEKHRVGYEDTVSRDKHAEAFALSTGSQGIGFQSGMKLPYKSGYHTAFISKGVLGEISKIEEELNELKDAENQNSKIMMLIELADLYGAIEEYSLTQGVTMEDLKIFSNITKRAFNNGHRK